MEAIKTMIHDQYLPMHLWDEEARTILYVHNRLSHSALEFRVMKKCVQERNPK